MHNKARGVRSDLATDLGLLHEEGQFALEDAETGEVDSEVGELWRESCLARRRFVGKKRQLIRRGGRYEDIANDDGLARLKAEWRASRVRVRRAIWSSKEVC